MILADTSAWIEFDRAAGSAVDARMVELLGGTELAVTEPVAMELLAGARTDAREATLTTLLGSVGLLPFDAVADFAGAARIYRRCRAQGVTPRGLLDCMIAAVAARTGAALLAFDADLARIATVIALDLDPATLRA